MYNSIKYFEENCIKNFEKLEDNFFQNPKALSEYIVGLTSQLHKLGLEMIKDSLEGMNQMILDSPIRLSHWVVECHSKKQLITSLGSIEFKKTLFKNKKTGKCEYLLDRFIGLDPGERLTEDAVAKLLEEAVQTSYRRGGEEASLTAQVSKQTVKNKIHQLEFPKKNELPKIKKVVDYLYIDADEDHVALQFRKKKGDLERVENNRKNNCLITKLVYVYDGIEPESPRSKRHRLTNRHYFCGVNQGKGNELFWDEVYEYIDAHYDLTKVKKLYVNSDGGAWIKAGIKRLHGATHVLDEFHLSKYITKLTSHMRDSQEDAKHELYRAIQGKTKQEFIEIVERLEDCISGEVGIKRIQESKDYILSNWTAARLRLRRMDGVKGSSTEGHVSHALSSRMSSRPMGWSTTGADKMSRLRAYYLNGGDMLELVRTQKEELPLAIGAEYDILSAKKIIATEKSRHGELAKYMDCISHSISPQNKKIIAISSHLWGI